MAPKPRNQKNAAPGKDTSPATKNTQKSLMLPPPDPPAPPGILEPEINALSTCLKNAAIKTGQIYSFYLDTRRLGIQNHAPKPPHALVASLGREVERFDQLIDTMESHLLRAVATLQRDLHREETRIKLEEEAAAALETPSQPNSPPPAPTPLPSAVPESEETSQPVPTPTNSPPVSFTGVGRRPSAISISSLHRPAFPLKLDLSSSSLRISAEEASMFPSGLASPVTLAPKSARPIGPNEFPDIMAAFSSSQTIDLTMTTEDNNGKVTIQNVGGTADKPIELDLDGMDIDMAMTDLFGDPTDSGSNDANPTMDGLFSPTVGEPDTNQVANPTESTKEPPFIHSMQTTHDNDIFSALNVTGDPGQSQQSKDESPVARSAPSPASLLANFESSSHLQTIESMTSNNMSGPEAPFDISSLDLSELSPSFFSGAAENDMNFSMDMDQFLATVNEGKVEGDGKQ